jgi:hypothetical protein
MSNPPDPALEPLGRLVGTWATEATHPAMPGTIVRGTIEVSWLEGERFLIHRARTDHPAFPDAIAILGIMDRDRAEGAAGGPLHMHYFDSRGVFRDYEASADDVAFKFWRIAPGFSQRFTGTYADDGATIVGRSEICREGSRWDDDLAITYRQLSASGPGRA